MKICTILGARPQFVKAGPVSIALKHAGIDEVLVHTGQHYDHDMSGSFFTQLKLTEPKYHLEVGSASHGKQTGAMLEKIEQLVSLEKPEAVLVYGDTNSTLAGALAAVKMKIPIFHVEAGLRSYNFWQPEEINRVITDQIASLMFAPTKTAVQNLLTMGRPSSNIHLVGDVMFDAAKHFAQFAKGEVIHEIQKLTSEPYILATIHRAENTDSSENLSRIVDFLVSVAKNIATPILPLHPRTRKILDERGLDKVLQKAGVKIISPVSFLEMIHLEKNAFAIVTDSGGIQKEAYFYGVPCITLRAETEWKELVENGINLLLPPSSNMNVDEVEKFITSLKDGSIFESIPDLYGHGDASEQIAKIASDFLAAQ